MSDSSIKRERSIAVAVAAAKAVMEAGGRRDVAIAVITAVSKVCYPHRVNNRELFFAAVAYQVFK